MEQVLLGGGALALVCAAGWLMLKHILVRADAQDVRLEALDAAYHHMMENHVQHNTTVLVDVRNALQELTSAIRERRI